ncbi:MAG: hypothetical protein AAF489_00240 [Bacteroidota bacterium]
MKTKLKVYLLMAGLILSSCATLQDHYNLTETIATKAMVETLFENATTPYSENEAGVTNLKVQLKKMAAYQKQKGKDLVMQKMWDLLNAESSAMQGFFKTWESQGTMSPAFLGQFTPEITKQLDLMINYESSKDKEAVNAMQTFLNTATN